MHKHFSLLRINSAIFLVFIFALVSCGGTTASHPSQPTITAMTPLPQVDGSDWPMYHRDLQHTGYLASFPDPKSLYHGWRAALDGAVYAEPLAVSGHVIVATEGDTLYSLDALTGQVVWNTHVGTPVPLSTLPCGNIDPLGITGTPVYDAATGLIFAVAEVSGPSHVLVAVDLQTGQIRWQRPVDPPGMVARAHQQRAALALANGIVYVAFGGLAGDCGPYHGWVVGVKTSGQGDLLTYQVPTTREGGIWAASGPGIDGQGNVYVSVGNGETTSGAWDHSDSVLRLSPQLQLEDGFAPSVWQQENAGDVDLGSMGPLLLPNNWLIANGKSGTVYLLKQNALGGIGGQQQQLALCSSFGGGASIGMTVFLPCTSGLQSIKVTDGAQLVPGWHATPPGSPVIGGHTVYSLDSSGTLFAFDVDTGATRASIPLESTSRFATPMLYGNAIYVGTMNGVMAVGIK
jgi:outer membrane protein assembly factor BamB